MWEGSARTASLVWQPVGIPHEQEFAKRQDTDDAVQVVDHQRVVRPSIEAEVYSNARYMLEIFCEAHVFSFDHHVRLHLCIISQADGMKV